MQIKTIRSILSRKMSAWWDSIEDERVRDLAKNGTIVSGGAITSMLLNEPINDFDVYFKDAETLYAVAEYYLKEFAKNPPVKFKGTDNKCVPIFLANASVQPVKSFESWQQWIADYKANKLKNERGEPMQLNILEPDRLRLVIKSAGVAGAGGSDGYEYFEAVPDQDAAGNFLDEMMAADRVLNGDPASPLSQAAAQADKAKDEQSKKPYRPTFMTSNAITLSDGVQIVVRFYGMPDQIHDNYDFDHCKCYWSSWDRVLSTPKEALICMMNKTLIYSGSRYPICSIFRARKFIERGWKINAGQLLKMAMQIAKLNLDDVWVLEDQLIGVDTAFFSQLINDMREYMEKNKLEKVDTTYLVELIDRIF